MGIVFFRVAWMNKYNGNIHIDIPINGGDWVNKNEDAGEAYNFTKCNGWYYGYVRPKSLDINRIQKTKDDLLTGTLVIFFATHPGGGQYIIGWYKHAVVFKNRQQINYKNRNGYSGYNAKAKIIDSHLVEVKDRWKMLPIMPGENNVWYGRDYLSKKQLDDILSYVIDPVTYKKQKEKRIALPKRYNFQNTLPRQPDIEKRRKVEKAGMDEVWKYYKLQGYKMKDVSNKNYGWDLEATLKNSVLKIEVKGLSGKDLLVELTHNEYLEFSRKKSDFKLAILTNALEKNKNLQIFQFVKEIDGWTDLENNRLDIRPMEFARIFIQK